MIRVLLPAHLRTLAQVNGEVRVTVDGPVTQRSVLDALRAEVAQKAPQSASAAPQEIAVEEPGFAVAEQEAEIVGLEAEAPAEPEPQPKAAPEPQPVHAAAPQRAPATLDDFVADLEASLPDDFMAPAGPIPPAHVIAPPQAPQTHSASLSTAPLPQSTGHGAAVQPALTQPPAAVKAVPPVTAPLVAPVLAPAAAEAGADLNDMFDELRAGLADESAPAEEDPEDHYNLGVAFREMGLIDEAIGELQKVCQAIDRGTPFKYTMQAYTWLAQCFLDKGVPEASIRWYEKALKLPNLDEEGRTALHYELASAYEAGQNKRAALAHFMEVYGANIDYRDVGERIHALKS